MQDDRSRLAVELDAALDRSRALEAANLNAGERLAHAAQAIGRIIDADGPGGGLSPGRGGTGFERMAQVSVTIDNRKYRLACNEGEEARLEIARRPDRRQDRRTARLVRRSRRPAARGHGGADRGRQPPGGARRECGRARADEGGRGPQLGRRRAPRPAQLETSSLWRDNSPAAPRPDRRPAGGGSSPRLRIFQAALDDLGRDRRHGVGAVGLDEDLIGAGAQRRFVHRPLG